MYKVSYEMLLDIDNHLKDVYKKLSKLELNKKSRKLREKSKKLSTLINDNYLNIKS